MRTYATSIRFHAPVHDVFSMFSDLSKSARCLSRVQRVETLSGHSSGLHAKYREWRVLENGRSIVQDFEVVAFDAGKRCTLESVSANIRFTSTAIFEQTSSETVVRISVAAQGLTLSARMLLPLVWPFTIREATRSLAHDLGELKACLERNVEA